MVRLVIRPYTQVWRTICTSVSLRASTRVSPGFALFRHSSPSFGSQHVCSHSNLDPEGKWSAAAEPHLLSLRLGVCHPKTRTYVRLLGPCFKTGWSEVFRQPSSPTRQILEENTPRVSSRTNKQRWPVADHRAPVPRSRRKMTHHQHYFGSLPSQRFQALFNSLFKVLCIFPSRYLFAIGLPPVFSFRWSLPPVRAAIPSNSTHRERAVRRKARGTDGTVTLHGALFQGTSPRAAPGVASVDYNSARRTDVPIPSVSSSRFSRPY